jgi:hypothetical protein
MILVCGSLESLTVLRLDLLVPGLKNIQFPRFGMALRPLWSIAAGLGVVWTVLRLRQARQSADDASHSLALPRLLAALLLAPLLISGGDAILDGPDAPVGRPQVLWNHAEADLSRELREQLRAESRKLAAGQRLKVAFLRKGMSARTYPIFAISDLGAGLVMDGHIPAINHRPELTGRSPETLRRLGVTHLVFDRPLREDSDADLSRAIEPLWNEGGWTLARLRDSEAKDQPWSEVEGGRRLERSFVRNARGWTLEVKDASAALTLKVAVSPYFRWTMRPEGGGERIELQPTKITEELQGLRFTLPGEGRFSLHRHELPFERGARNASWFCLLLCFLCVAITYPLSRDSRQPPRGHETRALSTFLAIFILAATGALLRQDAQLQRTWDMAHRKAKLGDPPGTPWSTLSGPSQIEVSYPSTPACSSLHARDPRAGCSPAELRTRRSLLYRHPYLYRCESIYLEGGDTRTVTLRPDRVGELLVMLTAESAQAGLVVTQGEQTLPLKSIDPTPLRLQTDDRAELVLKLQNKGPWGRRVCVAAAQSS